MKKCWLKIQKTVCNVPDHFWLSASTDTSYFRFLTESEQRLSLNVLSVSFSNYRTYSGVLFVLIASFFLSRRLDEFTSRRSDVPARFGIPYID